MKKGLDIILIGDFPDHATYVYACMIAQKKIDSLGLPHKVIILDSWEDREKQKNKADDLIKELAADMQNLLEIEKETRVHYEPGPSKLKKRKIKNELKNYAQHKFKTKIKSLKR